MPRPKISQEKLDQMFELWQDRLTTSQIARKLNVSYTSVYQELRRRYLVG